MKGIASLHVEFSLCISGYSSIIQTEYKKARRVPHLLQRYMTINNSGKTMSSKQSTSVIVSGGRESTGTPNYEKRTNSPDIFESGHADKSSGQLHYVPRGQEIAGAGLSTDSITGYEAEQMQARASLTFEEEKKLLRRIDWHLMPLLSICFLLKNIDALNVSNVRIMNTGTDQNILKELEMSSNEFNFVSTIYYVRATWFDLVSLANESRYHTSLPKPPRICL